MKAETSVSTEAKKHGTTRLGGALAQASETLLLIKVVEVVRNCVSIGDRKFATPPETAAPYRNNSFPVGERRLR